MSHSKLPPQRILNNFFSKIEKTDSCWLWRGGISGRGYGNFAWREAGKTVNFRAHRLSYLLEYGYLPKEMLVCHKCDNPICVNPAHLFLGTARDNAMDMVNKGRSGITHGEDCSYAKITEEDVKRMRKLRSCGETTIKLAEVFNISRQQVSKITLGQRWTHIPL